MLLPTYHPVYNSDVQCSTCGASWADTVLKCPVDDTPLSREVQHTGTVAGGAGPPLIRDGVDDGESLAIGDEVGEFIVDGKIGSGGMGCVYSATHRVIGKKAAIKVLRAQAQSQALKRFVREAQAVNHIGHPNLVDVFALGTLPDGQCYMLMECLEGETLAARIARGPIAVREAVGLLLAMTSALKAVHEHGFAHRDLKPSNIFLDRRGGITTLKILDFGIAKLIDGGEGHDLTRTGVVLGTPGYISPEQLQGRVTDHRVDLYALGVIAYEMIIGARVFVGSDALSVLALQAQWQPPDLQALWPAAPKGMSVLIAGLLAQEPELRPDLEHVLQQLTLLPSQVREDLVAPAGLELTGVASSPSVGPSDRRSVRVWGLAAALVATAATGIWVLARREAPASAPLLTAAEESPQPPPNPPPLPADVPAPAPGRPGHIARPDASQRPTPRREPPAVVADASELTVLANPWVSVYVDGALAARETPLRSHRLAAGSHQVRFVNGAVGFDETRHVVFEANKPRTIRIDVARLMVSVE